MNSEPPILEIRGLTAGPGTHPVLRDLSLQLTDAEKAALLGPSGSGKSTLLRCIAGLLAPRRGVIRIAGQEVFGPSGSVAPSRRGVAMVFQSYALWPHLSVREHLKLVAAPGEDPDAWIERLHLAGLAERAPGQLSGGEQARLALARALCSRPRLLLLDEPLRNLDPWLAHELRAELNEWFQASRLTVLLVTHDPVEAFALTGTLHLLEDGRISATGTPRDLYERPPHDSVATFLGRGTVIAVSREGDGAMHPDLGAFETTGPADGGRVLVRPEDLAVERVVDGPAEVCGVEFEGNQTLLHVRVGGHSYLARVDGRSCWKLGERVGLSVRRPVAALPTTTTEAAR